MKLLILLPRIPYPLEKGDKLRAFHQIRVLSENHDITLLAVGYPKEVNEEAHRALSKYCQKIHFIKLPVWKRLLNTLLFFAKGRPLQTGYFYSAHARKIIRDSVLQKQVNHLYCQLFRTADMVKGIPVKKTIDYQDAFSASMKKRMKAAGRFKKALLKIEYQRIRRYEQRIYHWFDKHTVISATDAEYLGLPEVKIIRNGVDTEFFNAKDRKQPSYDLIFSGNMSYLPNVHTALFLVNEVMPRIWEHKPEARLMLAGTTPDSRIQQLAGERVYVTGWLDDIRDAYKDAKVFIAPMQIGTGLQNKILEAMAMQLPCITSPAALSPIGARPGTEIRMAANSSEYARIALEILNNEKLQETMGQNAREFVIREFNWHACTKELEKLFGK